jgi:putative aldouronate transport system permease protein
MNILSLVIGLVISMVFAIMLNEVGLKFFKKTVQTVSFFPFFISWVVAYGIFYMFLAVNSGIINQTLMNLGIISEGVNFLGDPKYSWGLFVFSSLWKYMGYNGVLFLAAIAGIDTGLYEACDIDGADRLQKIWYITIPSLMPTMQVLLILSMGTLFSSGMDQYLMFTNAMNKDTMEVFDMYIYRLGVGQGQFSYTTAIGITKAIAGFVLVLVSNKMSKKMGGNGIL